MADSDLATDGLATGEVVTGDRATGDLPTDGVQDALAGTEGLDNVPVADHVVRFDVVHRALTDALSAIDGA